MMTYAFDGILEFNSKYEFVYQAKEENNTLNSYKWDFLTLSSIKDRLLFNQREVFLESLISSALYPEILENNFINPSEAISKF